MTANESIDATVVAAFATAIKQSPAWKAFEAANRRFDADPEMQRLMDHYRDLSARVRTIRGQGGHVSPEEMADLMRTQESIQNQEAFVRRQVAYGSLVRMLRAANEILSRQLGVDFARLAAPSGGGCCG